MKTPDCNRNAMAGFAPVSLLDELEAALDKVKWAEEVVLSNDDADIQHLLSVARGCLNKSIERQRGCSSNSVIERQ
jgi:hypothetical protein